MSSAESVTTARDASGVVRLVITTEVPRVVQRVTVTPRRAPMSTAASYLARPPGQWGWSDLRDYVVAEVEARHGPIQGRDPAREAAIFKRFLRQWGDLAVPIARFAFAPPQDGHWSGVVGITRFCKAADVDFAGPIAERLRR